MERQGMRSAWGVLALGLALFVGASGPIVGQSDGLSYVEDFGERKTWYSSAWDSGGFIQIAQDEENRTRCVVCPESADADTYAIDVAIIRDTGDRDRGQVTGLAGLEFRSAVGDEKKWSYAVLFDQDGRYVFFRLSPSRDVWEYLRHGETLDIRAGLSKVNHIEVEIGELNCYVRFNGGGRIGINAMIPRGGRVGCTVFNLDGVTTANFDNLCFRTVETSSIGD